MAARAPPTATAAGGWVPATGTAAGGWVPAAGGWSSWRIWKDLIHHCDCPVAQSPVE